MPNWAWFLAGIGATHLFWAIIIAGWWGIILRNSDPHDQEAFERDLSEIRAQTREIVARARKATLN